jgi:hypothetical protein
MASARQPVNLWDDPGIPPAIDKASGILTSFAFATEGNRQILNDARFLEADVRFRSGK